MDIVSSQTLWLYHCSTWWLMVNSEHFYFANNWLEDLIRQSLTSWLHDFGSIMKC
jgi:hypothetical protein